MVVVQAISVIVHFVSPMGAGMDDRVGLRNANHGRRRQRAAFRENQITAVMGGSPTASATPAEARQDIVAGNDLSCRNPSSMLRESRSSIAARCGPTYWSTL